MEPDVNDLVTTYMRNLRSQNKDDFWAWEEVCRLVKTDLGSGWKVTLLLLENAESDGEVSAIAAGPLEDFIDIHGHAALDRIEEACENNPRLRLALSTVNVLFYYDEFERWYRLLYKYGFRKDRAAEGSVIADVMKTMRDYLDGSINVYEYGHRITDSLDKPFDDKAAQRILQERCEDVELLDAKRPPDYQASRIAKPELKRRVRETIAELESLGYQAST